MRKSGRDGRVWMNRARAQSTHLSLCLSRRVIACSSCRPVVTADRYRSRVNGRGAQGHVTHAQDGGYAQEGGLLRAGRSGRVPGEAKTGIVWQFRRVSTSVGGRSGAGESRDLRWRRSGVAVRCGVDCARREYRVRVRVRSCTVL